MTTTLALLCQFYPVIGQLLQKAYSLDVRVQVAVALQARRDEGLSVKDFKMETLAGVGHYTLPCTIKLGMIALAKKALHKICLVTTWEESEALFNDGFSVLEAIFGDPKVGWLTTGSRTTTPDSYKYQSGVGALNFDMISVLSIHGG